jgi:uncharacterized protein
MTPHLAHIHRHPIKGHGREELSEVTLSAGQALPWDRHWAVAHEAARLDAAGGWSPCTNFARGAKAPALMAIDARLDTDARRITLSHPDLPDLDFRPDAPEDLPAFLDWVAPLNPPERAQPKRIVTASVPFTDTDYPSVSVLSLSSNRALGERMGQALSPLRWRGNLWIEGLAPWEEFELIGREIAIGDARLRIEERITRCKATTANPLTGRIDADTLGALQSAFGHQDFGVYARVIDGGRVARDDGARVL